MRNNENARITDSNGTAYHRYGSPVGELLSIKDALTQGGLDFRVAKQPVVVLGKETDFYATVRMDTQDTMGMVKEGYKVIQNDSAFDFFNPVIKQGEAIIETVGTLGKYAEKTFILARLPEEYKLGDVDTHRTYILLTNDHSGNGTCLAMPSDVRLACWNMFSGMMRDAKKNAVPMVKIRHSGDIKSKLAEAHKVMLVTREAMEVNQRLNERLITLQMRAELASKMFDTLLNIKTEFGKNADEINSRIKLNQKAELVKLFTDGTGMDIFPNAAYNYLNAVTEYVDHKKSVRGGNELGSLFVGGNGFKMKVNAENQLHQYYSS
jgi:phage/plasmid-like protein (TIGR03299 family)